MPINEINKCIDKFHKKNPSFSETVGDWAEQSIINNTNNVCETQETNKSAKIHKANVNRVNINRIKRKRVVCNEIKSNEIDVVIEEGYDDKESQHSAAKYYKLQSDNDSENVETSGQEYNDDEAVIKVSDQESEAKEAIKNTTSITKHFGCRPKAKQPNNHDDEGVFGQKSEVKEVVNNTTSTTKRSGRNLKAKQSNNDNATTG
ncbi:unnamed protein product [Rhizophagus irregularis]|nr:unnamed protein product [Rhizophagus irregularis]CAB4402050.1 unnamed protein product [Rhizophagus irregularis]CAB5383509.1 unnamed protein product [Rhizophagus irregularis]